MANTLITGASSGIGAELAERFANRGDDLILVARRRDRLRALADEIQHKHGVDVEVLEMDLSEPYAAHELWGQLESRQIDTVVNNAGFGLNGDIVDVDAEVLDQMVRLNCLTVVGLTSRFVKPMVARGCGTIINIASTASYQPVPHLAVYAASKALVLSLTEALWAEVKSSGVRVLAACPGPTETEFFDHAGRAASVGRMRTTGQLADGLMSALDRNAPSFIDGLTNRVIAQGAAFLPKKLVLRIAGAAIR
ncbi:SDR family NAD(P)-dependent oxidoreductase [Rothia uropygialis]|uniref:SDR family NAD(P)-dependent oxidoreductase n=1 Tax=Kocuria sp. 36 TaxID=1415402 RepID=UPI00101D395D|nr:SDR family oxidoreductase [Kocuria sp. 36]